MSASRTTPTECVFVRPMTVVRRPASRIHSSPVSSPFPFRRWQPAKAGSAHGSSAPGTMTVTPVRTGPRPDLQRAVALDQRRVADAHAGDVGDGVRLARRKAADDDPEVARAGASGAAALVPGQAVVGDRLPGRRPWRRGSGPAGGSPDPSRTRPCEPSSGAGSAWLWLKSAEPHSGQKSFAHPSGGRNARTTSSPCTMRRLPGSISACAEAAVPVRRWQRVQWQ